MKPVPTYELLQWERTLQQIPLPSLGELLQPKNQAEKQVLILAAQTAASSWKEQSALARGTRSLPQHT